MSIPWFILELAINLFESAVLVSMTAGWLGCKYQGRVGFLSLTGITTAYFAVISVLTFWGPSHTLSTLVELLVLFGGALLALKGSWLKKLAVVVTAQITMMICTVTIMLIIAALFHANLTEASVPGATRFMVLVSGQVIWFFVSRILLKLVRRKSDADSGWKEWLMLLLIPSISIVAILELLTIAESVPAQHISAIYIATACVTMACLSSYALYIRTVQNQADRSRLRLLEQEQSFRQQHNQEVQALYTQVRSIRHDMKNTLLAVESALNAGDNHAAMEKIREITDSVTSTARYIQTDNETVNFVLNTKLEQARRQEIQTHVESAAELDGMEDVDISILLGNLLDNAIEAAKTAPGPRTVEVKMDRRGPILTFQITNSVAAPVLSRNPELQSTKRDNLKHGFGLKSVRRIVRKYQGTLTYKEENNKFTVLITVLRNGNQL